MIRPVAVVLSVGVLAGVAWAGEPTAPPDQKARDSYSLGFEFGSNIKKHSVAVDRAALLAAIQDALDGREPAMSVEEIRDTLKQLRKKAAIEQDRRVRELAAKTLEEGRAFLAANRMKEGVQVLPSGLQYQVVQEGAGASPRAADSVTVRYRGMLVDGTEFDSSSSHGGVMTVPVHGVVDGWTEALQLMQPGAKWRLFIPPDLGYGKRPYGRIPPNSTLIFDVELVSVERSDAGTLPPGHSGDPAADHEEHHPADPDGS